MNAISISQQRDRLNFKPTPIAMRRSGYTITSESCRIPLMTPWEVGRPASKWMWFRLAQTKSLFIIVIDDLLDLSACNAQSLDGIRTKDLLCACFSRGWHADHC